MKSPSELFASLSGVFTGKGMKSQLARNGASSLILKTFDILFSFLVTVLLARTLGRDNYGVYSYVYALVALLVIPSQFGLPALVVRETAKAFATQEWGAIQGVWRWAGKITAILVIVFTCIAAVALIFFGDQFNREQILTMFWGLALVPLIALGELRGAALRGLHRIIQGQIPEQAALPGLFFLFVAVATIFFPSRMSPSLAMALQVAAAALAFIAGAWLLLGAAPTEVRHAQPIYKSRLWLASAAPLALIGGMQFINHRTSILILGLFADAGQIGIYRIADQMSLLASTGLLAMNFVVAPQFARLHAIGDTERLQKITTVSARIVSFLTLSVSTIFLTLGKPILAFVFGSEFAPAYAPMSILVVGQLVNSLTGSVGMLLNMTGHERETARGTAIAAASNIVLNFLLAPFWGVRGAALAAAITTSAWNVILLLAVRKHLKINSMAIGSFGKT